ncbi:MAG: hypothetical protein Kapaf2KO_09560 [Candidatus Kapaibacteriales bacterium]
MGESKVDTNTIKKIIIGLNVVLGILAIVLLSSFVDASILTKEDKAELPKVAARRSFEDVIQINVLNGCGESGLAANVQKGLRKMGFDVVEIGNFEQEIENTIIIDRLGDSHSAFKLAHSLGIEEKFIFTQIDSTMFFRASLVIGKDYKTLEKLPINLSLSIAG